MEQTIHEQNERIDKLLRDHKRTGIIYGIAIVIVTLVLNYIVLFASNVQVSFSYQSPLFGTYKTGTSTVTPNNL